LPVGVGDRLGGYDGGGKDDPEKGQKDYKVMHGFTPCAACIRPAYKVIIGCAGKNINSTLQLFMGGECYGLSTLVVCGDLVRTYLFAFPQGLKPALFGVFAARLKPCPFKFLAPSLRDSVTKLWKSIPHAEARG
jgi:hypothetical protein